LVCLDEAGKELVSHARPPLPARPGTPAREDPEYVRAGAANLFVWVAPHLGRRHVAVTERRTAVDFAHIVRGLLDDHFPDAERVVLVLDNLNTHTPASLYKAFPPAEAKRLLDRLEWHFTPKHGSWLNLAELELSALARQCLARRIPDRATLAAEVAAWAAARNAAGVRLRWTFGLDAARTKLSHLYPLPADLEVLGD
jgi:hypothetical protein